MKITFDVYVTVCPICGKPFTALSSRQLEVSFRNHCRYIHRSDAPSNINIIRIENEADIPDEMVQQIQGSS